MAKSRLKQLQDRAAAIAAAMQAMSDKLAAEERDSFTDEEDEKFKQLQKEFSEVEKGLEIEKAISDAGKKLQIVVADANSMAVVTGEEALKPQVKSVFPPSASRNYMLQNFKGEGRSREDWNKEAYTAGRFFLATCWKDSKSIRWCQENGLALQGYDYQDGNRSLAANESSNTAGAILVPDSLSATIITLKEKRGVFAKHANKWPMTTDTLTIPRRLSGLTAYFVSDGVSTSESQLGWDGVTLTAKELAVLSRYPMTLNDDAIIDMADRLTGEIAYAMADKEDQCGFNGDGTSTYGGIRGLGKIIDDSGHGNSITTNGTVNGGEVVAAGGGTSFGATVLGDYERMVGLLPEYASENAAWYFHRAGYAAGPQRLIDAAGGNTNATLSMGAAGSEIGPRQPMFLGYPVVISQVLNSTLSVQASTVVAFFGDLSLASSYGARKEIGISSTLDRYFEFRQIGIQGVERFDIVNHDLGNTTTAGPIVALKLSAT